MVYPPVASRNEDVEAMRPKKTNSIHPGAAVERDHARLVEQLRHSREELDHLVRALSHDMSANFMLLDNSFLQLKRALATEDPRPQVSQLVDHVEACLRQSQGFVSDLATLARTGRIEMEPERVEVEAVLEEVLFEQREPIAQQRVTVEVQGPLPVVWCNRSRLKQILTNLVRNALKHGCDPQRPQIVVSPATGKTGRLNPAESGLLAFQVYDNGRGIPRPYHEEVFLPGRRLAQGDNEGSGMGLTIVRKIAEYYGGAVWVDAECRQGTAVVVALPAPAMAPCHPLSPERRLGRDAPHEGAPLHTHQPFLSTIDPHQPV
jgi:signal transduction histidine kinase